MKHLVNFGSLFLVVLVLASCHTTYKEIGFGGGISARNFEKVTSSENVIEILAKRDTENIFNSFVIANRTAALQAKSTVNSKVQSESTIKVISPKGFIKKLRPINHTAQNKLKKQMLRENTNSKGLNLLLISLGLFVIGGLFINMNNYAGLLLGILICGAATIALMLAAFTFVAGWLFGG